MKADQLNGANLAYIGDAYFELSIRKYLLSQGITDQNELHNRAVRYVSAKSHNLIAGSILDVLTDDEKQIFKRGRNYKYRSHRNLNRGEYLNSSGFEAVIGYLYLEEKRDRLDFLIDKAIELIEERHE